MRALGATEEQIAAANLTPIDADFEVWEENWATVQMFLRIQTQWRVSMSGPVGLDYASLNWLCTLYPVEDQQLLFEGLQIMEFTALNCFSKKT